jgi:hypothetical protein
MEKLNNQDSLVTGNLSELIVLVNEIFENWFFPDYQTTERIEILIKKLDEIAFERGYSKGLIEILNYSDGSPEGLNDPFCLNNYDNNSIYLLMYLSVE